MNNSIPIEIKDLTLTRGTKTLFKNFTLTVAKLKSTCIMAPSGSGKTTLLSYVAKNLLQQNIPVSFLFQEPRLIKNATVLQNVMIPLTNKMEEEKAKQRAIDFICKVHLKEKMNELTTCLSGGEKQRVSIARSFAYPAKVLLMDEPFQSQDLRIKKELYSLFKNLLVTEPKTVLCATHDVQEAVEICDRIIVMEGEPLCIKKDIQDANKWNKKELQDYLF